MRKVKLYAGPMPVWVTSDERIVNAMLDDMRRRLLRIATAKWLAPRVKEWAWRKIGEVESAVEAAREEDEQ
jgi:hypothetical protein